MARRNKMELSATRFAIRILKHRKYRSKFWACIDKK